MADSTKDNDPQRPLGVDLIYLEMNMEEALSEVARLTIRRQSRDPSASTMPDAEADVARRERRAVLNLESISDRMKQFREEHSLEQHRHRIACREMDETIRVLREQLADANRQIAAHGQRARENSPADPLMREAVWALAGGKCLYCDVALTTDQPGADTEFCVDHLVPKAAGGPDHLANFVPACRKCNSVKRDKPVLEFARRAHMKPRLVSGGGQ